MYYFPKPAGTPVARKGRDAIEALWTEIANVM